MLHEQELNRLIGMALVDPQFEKLLLTNPALAAERVGLPRYEREVVSSIKASDLSDFARQLELYLLVSMSGGGACFAPS